MGNKLTFSTIDYINMGWRFYAGVSAMAIFFIAIAVWLYHDYRAERKEYPFRRKKDK